MCNATTQINFFYQCQIFNSMQLSEFELDHSLYLTSNLARSFINLSIMSNKHSLTIIHPFMSPKGSMTWGAS